MQTLNQRATTAMTDRWILALGVSSRAFGHLEARAYTAKDLGKVGGETISNTGERHAAVLVPQPTP